MILVTGGAGFLGKEVVRLLKSQQYDHNVRCLVRPGTTEKCFKKLFGGTMPSKLEIFPASFNDLHSLREALKGVKIVIHLAASLIGTVPAQVSNTVVGSENLFKVCVEEKILRIVLCSSFGVIGASHVQKSGLIDESIPIEPNPELRDPYSFAKQMQEQLAWQFFSEKNLPLVVVRPGVVFGPPLSILSSRIGLSLFGIFLHLGGKNKIPLIYKENCADFIIKAAMAPGVNGEIFCAVDDDLPSSKYLLSQYKKKIGRLRSIRVPYTILRQLAKFNAWYSTKTQGHLPAIFTPYKVDAMWKGHNYSNMKAKNALQWSPRIPMQQALDKTYEYMRKLQF